ncbi:hypothetical protein ACWIGW_31135 [Nocardia brasiliensis]
MPEEFATALTRSAESGDVVPDELAIALPGLAEFGDTVLSAMSERDVVDRSSTANRPSGLLA